MLSGGETIESCLADQIDFADVLTKVDQRKKESMDYLVNALNF